MHLVAIGFLQGLGDQFPLHGGDDARSSSVFAQWKNLRATAAASGVPG